MMPGRGKTSGEMEYQPPASTCSLHRGEPLVADLVSEGGEVAGSVCELCLKDGDPRLSKISIQWRLFGTAKGNA